MFVVCLSRVLIGKYFVSDVVAGFVLRNVNAVVFTTWLWVGEERLEHWYYKVQDVIGSFGL